MTQEQARRFRFVVEGIQRLPDHEDLEDSQSYNALLKSVAELQACLQESFVQNANAQANRPLASALAAIKHSTMPPKPSLFKGMFSELFALPRAEDWKEGSFMRALLSKQNASAWDRSLKEVAVNRSIIEIASFLGVSSDS